MAPDPGEALALWRYHLIAEAMNPQLTPPERGRIVRQLVIKQHVDPDGYPRSLSRNTLDRWIRRYRSEGLDGLRNRPRSDRDGVRQHLHQVMTDAIALRRELPARSAAHIADILSHKYGLPVSERTLREQFQKRGLRREELLGENPTVYGRFEAAQPNERWICDVLVGPQVPFPRAPGSQRARLFLIIDDHSRLIVLGRWFFDERARSGQEAFLVAIRRYGIPFQLHVDNGAAFVAEELRKSCGHLGVRLIHSGPHRPQGRGKLERLNRVVRERFLLEVEHHGVANLQELNDRFAAWAELHHNQTVNSTTEMTPQQRYAAVEPRWAEPELLRRAFLWSEERHVHKRLASIEFKGNTYEVDPSLRGLRVELRYRPEDLTRIEVWLGADFQGLATPLLIDEHVHPRASKPTVLPDKPSKTNFDPLGALLHQHERLILPPISFRNLQPGITPAGDDQIVDHARPDDVDDDTVPTEVTALDD